MDDGNVGNKSIKKFNAMGTILRRNILSKNM
jgi:hypothetical protein